MHDAVAGQGGVVARQAGAHRSSLAARQALRDYSVCFTSTTFRPISMTAVACIPDTRMLRAFSAFARSTAHTFPGARSPVVIVPASTSASRTGWSCCEATDRSLPSRCRGSAIAPTLSELRDVLRAPLRRAARGWRLALPGCSPLLRRPGTRHPARSRGRGIWAGRRRGVTHLLPDLLRPRLYQTK